jgi:phosphate transport system permease protein
MAEHLPNQKSEPAFGKKRSVLFGKDSDSVIKGFFTSSATVAIILLALITIFLFKEGAGFWGMYHKSLQEYRKSGLEYVDVLKETREDYTALSRYANDLRAEWIQALRAEGLTQKEVSKAVTSPEAKAFFFGYMRTGSEIRSFIKIKMDAAIEIRDQYITNKNLRETLDTYAEKIEATNKYNYKLDDQDRALFILRLNEAIQSTRLQADETEKLEALIAKLGLSKKIKTEERLLFLRLLQEKYDSIEKTIIPLNFAVEVQRVTSEQDEYTAALGRFEERIQECLLKADAIALKN